MRDLNNMRVAIIAMDGFEEVELTEPMKALKENGANVEVLSEKPGEIQGFRHHDKAGKVSVDRTLDQAKPGDYDGILLPGGALISLHLDAVSLMRLQTDLKFTGVTPSAMGQRAAPAGTRESRATISRLKAGRSWGPRLVTRF
ncbi:MAG: DJ-1/PfpI family protein [Acidobacteriia bacterium]|nr:DJ-1/PfpI family protein [Terriglobia bacterium]